MELIDIWLASLVAVNTQPTGREDTVGWMEDPSDYWYNALTVIMGCFVIDVAKLLVAKDDTGELFRPAVRKVL